MRAILLRVQIAIVCALFLAGCGVSVGWKPPLIPIAVIVNIDQAGAVTLTLEAETRSVRTPLGEFWASASIEPTQYLNSMPSSPQSILTVRVNGKDYVFDLQGQEANIKLASGYYQQIELRGDGKNWLLIAVATNSVTIPIPTSIPVNQPTAVPINRSRRLLNNGAGLTTGERMNQGNFQVEGYCHSLGYGVHEDGKNWHCLNVNNSSAFILREADFTKICQLTYNNPNAFAVQDGSDRKAAYRWRCYAYES